jgi:hypothetical protein
LLENEYESDLDSAYRRGYFEGIRLGITKGIVENYRRFIAKDRLEILMMLYKDDVILEIARFHKIYGNIDSERMADHIVYESEYMVDVIDYGTFDT